MPPRHPLDHPHIDALWTAVAAASGFRVVRAEDAYASVDGRGTMTIGTPQTLDADDCLAVLVLHELCHGFVQGLHRWTEPDFGLDNTTDDDQANEYAALRVQAALADRFALRPLFFSTTVWRPYYEALPADPLFAPASSDPLEPRILALTAPAWICARAPRYARPIARALARTAAFAREHGLFGPRPDEHPLGGPLMSDLASGVAISCQLSAVSPAVSKHAIGSSVGTKACARLNADRRTLTARPEESALAEARPAGGGLVAGGSCGRCVWRGPVAGRPAIGECVRRAKDGQPGPRVAFEFPACSVFAAALDCQTCGACCREAYHAVPVGASDPFRSSHPTFVVRQGRRFSIRRDGPRCAALSGSGPYACDVYADRPRTCRDFTAGSENCRIARQRVGLLTPVTTRS
jgi:hypothetical protein